MTPSTIKPRPVENDVPAGDSLLLSGQAAETESPPTRLNVPGQFRVGLCLALTLVGLGGSVFSVNSEAASTSTLSSTQAQVQIKAATPEVRPLVEEGWLLAGQSAQSAPVEEILKVEAPPPPAFQPARPVTQKGDYVAHGVNFSQLLSNEEFTHSTAATSEEIQRFLESKDSFLAEFEVDSVQASQLLVQVAQEEGVNPWLLVTTLEKENSMVSRQSQPKQHVMKAAMGYGHTDKGNRAGRNNNFENQIRKGASLLRQLYDEGQQQAYPRSMKVDFGKRTIKVRNAASYALMRYTPHTVDTSLRKVGGGNYLFRHILEDFTEQSAALRLPMNGELVAQGD
jgi:hypothetical protein